MIGVNPDYDYLHDPQQASPAAWCCHCGAEVWEPEQDLCSRCAEEEGD